MTKATASSFPDLSVFIDGIGLVGPGLPGWAQSRLRLEDSQAYQAERCLLPSPMALPPAERRRAGAVVKVSLAAGEEAVSASGLDVKGLRTVFSSSSGDAVNCHEICAALTSSDRLISPTRFHNSVHNSSSGYWSISSRSMATSSVLCAHDGSFSAGLLEAIAQVAVEQTPVLLIAYDTDYPAPLHAARPIPDSFGVALVLTPLRSEHSLAKISLDPVTCVSKSPANHMEIADLEQLRQSIPAARCLPLLRSIATQGCGAVVLDYISGLRLTVQVEPCQSGL